MAPELTLVVVDDTSLRDLPIGAGPWRWVASLDDAHAHSWQEHETALVDTRPDNTAAELLTYLVEDAPNRRTVAIVDDARPLLRLANDRNWAAQIVLGYAESLSPA